MFEKQTITTTTSFITTSSTTNILNITKKDKNKISIIELTSRSNPKTIRSSYSTTTRDPCVLKC
ncbi:MAG: hypothetical protein B6U97_03075 [Candidatus Altiarchaeales archaeon ex4484_96]|nr:MAG: hypothetical protein B6U97_03075 [Candidatus Altiarchaeales archaeon ex4484_96]